MKYFGTDGIRQPASQFTTDFLAHVVAGLADYAASKIPDRPAKVFLAGDTRESTEWILQDLASALESAGFDYSSAGVLPTPAINYCFYEMGFDFAIDVTASHNPYTDNGIKIFEHGAESGAKLSLQGCEIIEQAITEGKALAPVATTLREDIHTEAVELYLAHLRSYLGEVNFHNLRLGLDCANGTMGVIGATIFEEFGAKVHLINYDTAYGQGINRDCGSTHLAPLQALVNEKGLDFGVAFDGDGDRCLMVDSKGNLIDGDRIIAILANYLQLDAAAITVMSNQGLLNWAEQAHIHLEITPVGDSNVAAAMQAHQIKLGGEQSGHIILPGQNTGDGMLTALMVTKVISEANRSLRNLASIVTRLPQVVVNLDATPAQKSLLATSSAINSIIAQFTEKIKTYHGRLLVRPSGTEPLIRITLWGDDEPAISTLAQELKTKLGEVL